MDSSNICFLLLASSALPYLTILMFFIFMCHELLLARQMIIRHQLNMNLNYINLATTRLKLALKSLFGDHSMIFKNYLGDATINNGEEEQLNDQRWRNEEHMQPAARNEEEAVDCAVCLCKIEEGEERRDLRCGHLYHRVCLDRWLGYRHGTCPLCRQHVGPRGMVTELGEQIVVLKFWDFSSRRDRDDWWLR